VIIAISAPPVTDKATLTRSLAERYSLPIERDPSSAVCRSWGFQTLYEMPVDLQRQVRLSLLTAHRDALMGGAPRVYDYSAFEMLADWMRWFWGATPTEEWENVLTIGRDCASRYEQLYHLENGADLPYDGYVWFDRRNAAQQGRLIRHLYTELGVHDRVRFGAEV
jgi:hypothetical protein